MAGKKKVKKRTIKGDDAKILAINEKLKSFHINQSLARLSEGLGAQGTGFGGERNLYDTLGWVVNPEFSAYITYYKRSIGKTVVDIAPTYMWNGPIKLAVSAKDQSELPEIWKALDKRLGLTNILLKADKLAGVLNYSIIFLGLDDDNAKEPEKAVPNASDGESVTRGKIELRYVKAFRQDNALVKLIEGDITSPNFGKVAKYDVTTLSAEATGSSSSVTGAGAAVNTPEGSLPASNKKIVVDASRCIHIAEDIQDGDIYGTPRMEACLNNIQDLEKVNGGSAEMFWRGAMPGWAFSVDPDAEYDEEDIEDMDDQIDDMLLGLNRYIKMQGITVTPLAPQVSDPRPHASAQLQMISAIRRIPLRLLVGSESGELASSQDGDNWDSEIQARRRTEGEPWVRLMVDRLMSFGVLPFEAEYEVIFPPVNAQNEELRGKVALNLSLALKNYTTSINPEKIMPRKEFLTTIMGYSDDEAKEIADILEKTDNEDTKFTEVDTKQAEEDAKLVEQAKVKMESTNGG